MTQPRTGVLVLQLGTPDDPSPAAVRRYLREFLSDRRVIEAPRVVWWPVLNFQVLRTRPQQSAEKYRRIWDPQTGSPLLHFTRRQTAELQKRFPVGVPVRFAMRYGNPSTRSVVTELIALGVERIVVLPMYPQYSATTTASALDALFRALLRERRVPALRIIAPYYSHPAYIDAMAGIIREQLAKLTWQPDHCVLSFHGIPQKYVERGDPYPWHCEASAKLIAARLGWVEGKWSLTYQSILGKDPWLQPYTEATLEKLVRSGNRKIFIATPGFTADCLETIDEVGREAREVFEKAGGEHFHRCPCLNDHPLWIEGMEKLVREEAGGLLEAGG
jgi:ferrochelatase